VLPPREEGLRPPNEESGRLPRSERGENAVLRAAQRADGLLAEGDPERGHQAKCVVLARRNSNTVDMPELERGLDKERKGAPLIIELDSVDGMIPGHMLKMLR